MAFAALASRFLADSSAWLRLGDARFNADNERAALEAYRHAASVDPGNADAQRAVLRVAEVLRLDPTLRGLSVRARARRWDVISQRVLSSAASCSPSQQVEKAMALLKKPAASLEVSDQKVDTTLRIWQGLPVSCRLDPVLIHIMAKAADYKAETAHSRESHRGRHPDGVRSPKTVVALLVQVVGVASLVSGRCSGTGAMLQAKQAACVFAGKVGIHSGIGLSANVKAEMEQLRSAASFDAIC